MLSHCPRCGAETRAGARFCYQCGAALDGDTATDATSASAPMTHVALAPTLVGAPGTAPAPPIATSLPSNPPPFPFPPYGPPTPMLPPRLSRMALAGFWLGVCTVVIGIFLTWLGTIMGICGLVFSLIGLAETGRHAFDRGQLRSGRGFAIAGIILSIIGIIGSVLLLIYILQHAEQFGIQLPRSLRP